MDATIRWALQKWFQRNPVPFPPTTGEYEMDALVRIHGKFKIGKSHDGWSGPTELNVAVEQISTSLEIEFTCPECEEVQRIEGKLADILSEMHESGWPICPECGTDMEENVLG